MTSKFKRFGSLLVALALVLGICLVRMPVSADDSASGPIVYQMENFYNGTISEGVAADMQPGESIAVALNSNSGFVAGEYILTVRSCGDRKSFDIQVNGESVGTINRSGTNFGQNQMTSDMLYAVLSLKADDVITVVAPGSGYGWVDYLQLDPVCSNIAVYQVENYYSGGKSGDGIAADMQPNETIAIALNSNSGFVAGKYVLTLNTCGNRTSYDVLVNGESVGTVNRTGTGFGINELTADKLGVELELKSDDVITIVAPADGYGWVDYLLLTSVHSFTTKVSSQAAQPAGCTSAATYYVQCDYCDAVHETKKVASGDPAGHSMEPIAAKDATCTEDGNNAYYYCTVCKKYYKDEAGTTETTVDAEIVPAGHIDEDPKDNVCDRCEESLCEQCADVDTDTDHKCDACGKTVGGHVWDDGSVTKGPTCTEPGEKTYTCNCGETKMGEAAATGHSMEPIAAADSTCTKQGNNAYYYCDKCEKYFKDEDGATETTVDAEKLPLDEHQWDDGVVTKEATATAEGEKTYTCGICTGTKTEPVSKLPGYNVSYDYIIYQCEDHYSGKISEGVAADLQPGEQLSIALGSDETFESGYYKLTIYSCGNRETFDILVNGEKVGTVTRTGTGFGQDQMTYDKLSVVLQLRPEDTITLAAPTGEYWGWVDFIVLDTVREAPETGDGTNLIVPAFVGMSVLGLAVLLIKKRRCVA